MTTRTLVRITATTTLVIGLIMFLNAVLNWNALSGALKGSLQSLHVILGLALVGLYEVTLSKRKGYLTESGKQLGWIGRVLLVGTLLIGFYIVVFNVAKLLDNNGYITSIWVHAIAALSAIAFTEIVFSKRRLKNQSTSSVKL